MNSWKKIAKLPQRRFILIVFVLLIILTSYSLFFYLQDIIEKDTKSRVFYQQIENQLDSTKKISKHIGSDLDAVIVGLQGLANSVYLQRGQLTGAETEKLVEETFSKLNTITVVERISILNERNQFQTIYPVAQPSMKSSAPTTLFDDLIHETRVRLSPVLSNGLGEPANGYRIAVSYPVLDRQTKDYIGMILAVIPTGKFFEHYGNIHNIETQYLVAYDRNGTYLASPFQGDRTPNEKNEPLGSEIEQFIKLNRNLNDRVILYGQENADGSSNFESGERLSTGYPILTQGKHSYSIFVVTPTSLIYSQVNDVLFLERLEMFLLLSGTTISVAVLIIVLHRWNSTLDREVRKRTRDLAELNEQLAVSNRQLKIHDQMQKEFIDIAAHELRTPLQPILSYNALASKGMIDKDESFRVIGKQARRLEKLANDLLAVNRIETGGLPYRMERVKINDLIREIVDNYRYSYNTRTSTNGNDKYSLAGDKQPEIAIETDLDNSVNEIYADKDRIVQVLTNILDNALKFTKKGKVKIESHLCSTRNEIEIRIIDTGRGISEDILHNLFDRFATRRIIRKEKEHGSGLGLYISNAIIGAHGGRITAQNNDDGGATFTIILPTSGSH